MEMTVSTDEPKQTAELSSVLAYAMKSGDVAKMGANALVVYVAIRLRANAETMTALVTLDTITDMTSLSRRHVMGLIDTLEEFGYLDRRKEGRRNVYGVAQKPTTVIDPSEQESLPSDPSRTSKKFRYLVLSRSNGRCCLCGRSASDGAVLQIDHIKSKFRFPELAKDPSNYQTLCQECNVGKGELDDTDWRWDGSAEP